MAKIININNNNINIDVIKMGSGERCFVMLPGLSIKAISLSAEAIEGSYSQFYDKYTIYAFDIKKDVRKGITIDNIADDIVIGLKELGLDKIYLFGVSQGGMIAQRIAIKHPEMVAALFVTSTIARVDEFSHRNIGRWIELAKKRDAKAINHDFVNLVYSKEIVSQMGDVLENMYKDITDDDLAKFEMQAEACIGFDTYDELDKIKAPTMVIGAGDDIVLGVKGAKEIIEKLGCEGYIYEGCAHGVYDEAPDFKDRIQSFFDKY